MRVPARRLPHLLLLVGLLASGLLRGLSGARADEAERVAEASALLTRLAALTKAKDRVGLEPELAKVAALHNALDDKALRGRLQAAVGDALMEPELGSARVKAAEVLGELHDERVWAQLKRAFPAPELEAGLPVHLAVVAAAGRVAAAAAAQPLLELLRKGRDPNLVRAAVEALGGFGWAKSRVTVLGGLLDVIPLTEGNAAGGARGAKVSPETAAAWRALKPTLLTALNALTGRAEASLEHWVALEKQHKKDLEALFVRAK